MQKSDIKKITRDTTILCMYSLLNHPYCTTAVYVLANGYCDLSFVSGMFGSYEITKANFAKVLFDDDTVEFAVNLSSGIGFTSICGILPSCI